MISGFTLFCIGFVGIVCCAVPPIAALLLYKKRGGTAAAFFWGCGMYIMFNIVLSTPVGAILTMTPLAEQLWFTVLYSGLTAAMMDGAKAGVELVLSLAGALCLWSGFSRLLEAVGATAGLAKLLSPLLRRLFPEAWQDREAREAICGNMTANLLGLGNAATPLGIRAACRMHHMSCADSAGDELCRLIVMNTASIQLIPTTVAAVRAGLGASAPLDILPAVWVTSLCSVAAGLAAAKLLSRWL
jgi:spore maturation protein A